MTGDDENLILEGGSAASMAPYKMTFGNRKNGWVIWSAARPSWRCNTPFCPPEWIGSICVFNASSVGLTVPMLD
jgi:hypothetical protein